MRLLSGEIHTGGAAVDGRRCVPLTKLSSIVHVECTACEITHATQFHHFEFLKLVSPVGKDEGFGIFR
jgi:hypothetical protein